MRAYPKARQAKSKARLARFEELNSREFQKRNETLVVYIPPGSRLCDMVIEANNISKQFGDRIIFENVSFNIPAGAIVGIIGPNGAGKSTLFKMLMRNEAPDTGSICIGESVKLAFVDQSRDSLDDNKAVWQEISNDMETLVIGNYQMAMLSYVGRFNIKGTDKQKIIKNLSCGERNRVHHAKVLSSGGNVMLLDEPTNDLDVETLRAMEEEISSFPGCVLVVSHDRWFLDRVATHILAFEGDSHVEFFAGNYTDYEADRVMRLGESAKQPHRIR